MKVQQKTAKRTKVVATNEAPNVDHVSQEEVPKPRIRNAAGALGAAAIESGLDKASPATMLARCIAPWEHTALLHEGIRLAADDLEVFSAALQNEELTIDPVHAAHSLAGIEGRLRALSEIAARVERALHDATKEVAS